MKKNLFYFALILELAGGALLLVYAGWKVSLGIALYVGARQMYYHTKYHAQ